MTTRYCSWHITIAFAVLSPALAATQVVHVEHNQGWSSGSVSNAALDARLREAAVQYRRYAPVPRVAFFDVAYPRDCGEFVAMKGHGVIVVTAVAQDSTELPPSRVYAVTTGTQTSLSQVAAIDTRVAATDAVVSATFGNFRHDGIYLLPVAASRAQADVLLDFAAHRVGFRLAHLSGQFPRALDSCSPLPPGSATPAPAVIWELVEREYSDLGRTLRAPR